MNAILTFLLCVATVVMAALKLAGIDPFSGWSWWAVMAPAIAWVVLTAGLALFFFGVLSLFWRRMG